MKRITPAVVFYLLLGIAAAAAANLLIKEYGAEATPYVAFMLVGLDLVVRDRLHISTDGWDRWGVIGLLIVGGSIVTYIVNQDAGDIALASVVAFGAALIVDTIVFTAASGMEMHRRVNLSNIFAALADTLVFFAIAFGLSGPFTFPPEGVWVFVFAQFFAKVAGGAIWGLLLIRERSH